MANEKRLIYADDLREEIESLSMTVTGLRAGKGVLTEFMKQYRDSVLRIIDEQPTVDAVEVVRCKDCRHWDSETGWCNNHSAFDDHDMDWNIYNDDDFCSYGERRNDG